MDKRFEQTLRKRRYTNGQQSHEKLLNTLVIREMQNKTTVSYHNTSTRVKKTDHTSSWQGDRATGIHTFHADEKVKQYSHLGPLLCGCQNS